MSWLLAEPNATTVWDTDPTLEKIQAALGGYAEQLIFPGETQCQWLVHDEGAISDLPVTFLRKDTGHVVYGNIVGTCSNSFNPRTTLLDEFNKLFMRQTPIEELTNDTVVYVGLTQIEARLLLEVLVVDGATQVLVSGKLSPKDMRRSIDLATTGSARINQCYDRIKALVPHRAEWFRTLGHKLLVAASSDTDSYKTGRWEPDGRTMPDGELL